VLVARLTQKDIPPYPKTMPDPKVPIFVTWMIKDDLRGCIGTFAPSQLSAILGKYALISALQDDRFDPVHLTEVKILNVGVSLLVNF
jgi:AMMECR1 domain-containing protein